MRVSFWLAFLASSLLSCIAAAEQAESEDPQLLFDSGLQSMMQGDYGIGCALIKRSQDLDPRPGTLFTLAECYAKAGKIASALETYDEFLALDAKLPADARARQAKRVEISKQARAKLIARVPWLTVVLPEGAPPRVVVTMDDESFAPNLFGIAIAVDPGRHWFSTSVPGGLLTEQDVELKPGDRKTLVLSILGVPNPPTTDVTEDTEPVEPETESKGPNTWVYITGGIGVAGLATGAVTGIILLSKKNTINEDCQKVDGEWHCETQEGIDAIRSAQNVFAPITTVALGVGVAGLATAAILWLADGSGKSEGAGALQPHVGIHPHGANAGVRGHF